MKSITKKIIRPGVASSVGRVAKYCFLVLLGKIGYRFFVIGRYIDREFWKTQPSCNGLTQEKW